MADKQRQNKDKRLANLKPCKKGETHNPNGRPKITKSEKELRELIRIHAPEIIDAMAKQAKKGRPAAAGILLKKVISDLASVEVEHSGTVAVTTQKELDFSCLTKDERVIFLEMVERVEKHNATDTDKQTNTNS